MKSSLDLHLGNVRFYSFISYMCVFMLRRAPTSKLFLPICSHARSRAFIPPLKCAIQLHLHI